MRTIFLADAHLQQTTDSSYLAMLRFLEELRGSTETLYIMGDFFEFWIGYKEVPFTQYLPVLDSLLALRKSGTEIIYFEGNHDFHMGSFFTETLEATVFQGPTVRDIGGSRTLLCHGDQANRSDIPYRLLRLFFHSSFTRWLSNALPPWVACTIAERMGRKGRTYLHLKGENPAVRSILVQYASERFTKGDDMVIAGHFHMPFIEKSPGNPGKRLVSLGAWAAGQHYAELIGSEVVLKQYH